MALSHERFPGSVLAYEVGREALAEQLDRAGSLDAKAAVLVGAGGVLTGLFLTEGSPLTGAPRWFAAMVYILLVGSVAAGLSALIVRRYELAPSPEQIIRFMIRPPDWLKWRFLRNVVGAIEVNERKLTRKARLTTVSIVSLLLLVALLGGYLLREVVT